MTGAGSDDTGAFLREPREREQTVGSAVRLARSVFCRRLLCWGDQKAARDERTVPLRGGCTMRDSDDSRPRASDPDSGEDLDEDPGEDLEAMIEQADRPFASESFGTTAEEQEEGEPLDQKLAEERPSKPPFDSTLAIEDVDAPDDEPEMVGQATIEHDPFVAPEEAAMTVSEGAPGAVDHPDAHDDVERDDESSEEA